MTPEPVKLVSRYPVFDNCQYYWPQHRCAISGCQLPHLLASVTFHIGFPVMRMGRRQSPDCKNSLDGVTCIKNFLSYGAALGCTWSSANKLLHALTQQEEKVTLFPVQQDMTKWDNIQTLRLPSSLSISLFLLSVTLNKALYCDKEDCFKA